MVAGRRNRKATATATGSCIVKEERCSSVVKSSSVLKLCKSESKVKVEYKAERKIKKVVRKKGETQNVVPYKVVRKIETEKVVRNIKADKEMWECTMLKEVTTEHESSLGGWRTTEPLDQVVKRRDDAINVLYTCRSRTTGCNLLDKIEDAEARMGSAGLGGDGIKVSKDFSGTRKAELERQARTTGCRRQEIPKDGVGGRPFLVAMPEVPVVQDLQDNTPGSSTIVGRF